jgi:predicted CXXCH cytochrome family protein
MKYVLFTVFFVISVFVGVEAKEPPNIISIPNREAAVVFPHKQHADAIGNCRRCHDRKGGKIKGLGKKWAHKVCKGCHLALLTGPVTCNGCHTGGKGAKPADSGNIY